MQCEKILHLHSLNISGLCPHAHFRRPEAKTPTQAILSLTLITINKQLVISWACRTRHQSGTGSGKTSQEQRVSSKWYFFLLGISIKSIYLKMSRISSRVIREITLSQTWSNKSPYMMKTRVGYLCQFKIRTPQKTNLDSHFPLCLLCILSLVPSALNTAEP